MLSLSVWSPSRASMFVLSEYLTSKDGQHSSGKLKVRGLQIHIVPEQFPNHCEVNVFLVSEDQQDPGIAKNLRYRAALHTLRDTP